MRKPETRIYKTVLKKLNVDAADAVFLDDLGHNLKSARALGIHTIKVVGDGSQAVDELEQFLGFSLRNPEIADVPGKLSKSIFQKMVNYRYCTLPYSLIHSVVDQVPPLPPPLHLTPPSRGDSSICARSEQSYLLRAH